MSFCGVTSKNEVKCVLFYRPLSTAAGGVCAPVYESKKRECFSCVTRWKSSLTWHQQLPLVSKNHLHLRSEAHYTNPKSISFYNQTKLRCIRRYAIGRTIACLCLHRFHFVFHTRIDIWRGKFNNSLFSFFLRFLWYFWKSTQLMRAFWKFCYESRVSSMIACM